MFDGAFLVNWNDVDPAVEAEYRRWHRVEHMPERLAVPGFSLGRRYTAPAEAQSRYLTIYEVTSVAIFRSAAYLARLAEPTPWTRSMSARMTNFVRRVCRTAASQGDAIGGAAATLRLRLPERFVGAEAAGLVRQAAEAEGVIGAHLGAVDAAATEARTDAMQYRAMPETFNAVLVVESDSRAALAAVLPALREAMTEIGGRDAVVMAQVYDLALALRRRDAAARG